MRLLLSLARSVIGIMQSALLLGGCGSILVGSGGLLSACVLGFLALCVVQLLIVGLAVLTVREG